MVDNKDIEYYDFDEEEKNVDVNKETVGIKGG